MTAYVYDRNPQRRGTIAKKIARMLGLRVVGPGLRPRAPRVSLLNWGCSVNPEWANVRNISWLGNTPQHVSVGGHKLRCLRTLRDAGVPTLEFTQDRREAQRWFDAGSRIYARTVLQGHSGDGLVFHDPESCGREDIAVAPLYTRDFGTPFKEYRVHVAFGEVIDITMKKRMSEESARAKGILLPDDRTRLQVRVYENGWTFAHHNILDHPSIHELALSTAAALNNMPMCAVDIAARWRRGTPTKHAVIEVNSAPALRAPTTIAAYERVLQGRINA